MGKETEGLLQIHLEGVLCDIEVERQDNTKRVEGKRSQLGRIGLEISDH
jgi:hypothetical protein